MSNPRQEAIPHRVPPTTRLGVPRAPRGGAGDSGASEILHVDYRDVLEQAVSNERWRVLREIRKGVSAIATRRDKSYGYGTEDRRPEDVKADIERILTRMEEGNG